MKHILSGFLCVAIVCGMLCACQKKPLIIYSGTGKVLAEGTKRSALLKDRHKAYAQIVWDEAIEILSEQLNCKQEEAKKALLKKGYSIYTYYDDAVTRTIEQTYQDTTADFDFGCAITTLQGDLIAAYSAGQTEMNRNFTTEKTPPYSTFKPLAVYAPALEKGLIHWSTVFEDSPYKKIEDSTGKKRDWPENATGTYSNEPVTVYHAIKHSLNTVAVKCLAKSGVNPSIEFLMEKFHMDLSEEQKRVNLYGKEEVIGNIALGYLIKGVSPVDMAGYYEVFANSGQYTEPKTISKICDAGGKTIYERKRQKKQVFSPKTAEIMNRLLQGVITPGGTGEKAALGDIPVAGKTGTGDNNSGNWFVGVTPEYSCAVWHSTYGQDNRAAETFSKIMNKVKATKKEFSFSEKVIQKIYCTESGNLLGSKCKKVDLGYYTEGNLPDVCNIH